MREEPLSNCEREFLLQAIAQKKRLDGREAYDYRNIKITFGVDRGCCTVQLGHTRVLAQVSCEVTQPKQSRPTEGMLFVNLELSPMAAPEFEAGRQSDARVQITRLLERCIKESRCVDTESLCIMAGVKVWSIRVDIHALNHDGNLVDCSSIAAIAALAHFRRPDITVTGEEVTIHSLEDKDPVPLSVHHMPLCVTFAFFEQGKYLLVDPTEKEERVMDGKMVIGMNKHREICTFQMSGSMLLQRDQVLRCSNIAVVKVTEITELIQRALQADTAARARGEKFGFAVSVEVNKVTAIEKHPEPIAVETKEVIEEIVLDSSSEEEPNEKLNGQVIHRGPGTAQIGQGGPNTWLVEDDSEPELEVLDQPKSRPKSRPRQTPPPVVVLSGDSEEEDTVTLGQKELEMTKNDESKPVPTVGNQIDLSLALKIAKKKKAQQGKNKKKSKPVTS